MLPASARSSPHISRIAVVLPAPSEPISPNISPRCTSRVRASSALVVPYFLTTPSNSIAAFIEPELRIHRHPLLQHAGAVIDGYLDAVDQLRPLVGCLDIPRRELRLWRHVGDLARHSVAG